MPVSSPTRQATSKPHRCPYWMHYLLASPLRRLLEPIHRQLRPLVRPGMTVLEPGCGFGYVSLQLARLVGPAGRVLCVDVEPRAVDRLLGRARRAGLQQRIQASVCSPTDLGLAAHTGQVDLATVIHTLHELEDLPGFARQLSQLLVPGGQLLVVEPPGHVTPTRFAAMLEVCEGAGLRRAALPGAPDKKRLHALLELPSS